MGRREKENKANIAIKWIKTWVFEDNIDHRRTCWNWGRKYIIHLWQQLWSGSFKPGVPRNGGENQVWICFHRVHHRAERSEHIEEVQKAENSLVQRKLHYVFASDRQTRKLNKLENTSHWVQGQPHYELYIPQRIHHLPLPMYCSNKPRRRQGSRSV